MEVLLMSADQHHVALAERIVERAAYYEEMLRHCGKDDIGPLRRDLSDEYYLMRIALVHLLNNICGMSPITDH